MRQFCPTWAAARVAILGCVLLSACRDAASSTIPATPLGRFAKAWLRANNLGGAHALLHFMLEYPGRVRMTPSQQDSALQESVRLAQRQGTLVPIRLLYSTDTALAIIVRSDSAGMLKAVFRPARQPNPAQVVVELRHSQLPAAH
jgi:hypothetical protein